MFSNNKHENSCKNNNSKEIKQNKNKNCELVFGEVLIKEMQK